MIQGKDSPVYQTKGRNDRLRIQGNDTDITQWISHSGNMQMVVELKPSGGRKIRRWMEGLISKQRKG